MKLSSAIFALSAVAVSVTSAFQSLQTSDGQLTISSPLVNGIYVAGKILPCTYIPSSNANLILNLYIRGTDVLFNGTVIAINADTSSNPSNAISNNLDGTVYYQHSVNYFIPPNAPGGNYEVTFQNVNTKVNTTIPVSILPFIVPSTANDVSLGPAATATTTSVEAPSSTDIVIAEPTTA